MKALLLILFTLCLFGFFAQEIKDFTLNLLSQHPLTVVSQEITSKLERK
jgi:hypothetical protein